MGRPRKTPNGGKNVTFYLPVEVIDYVKENGGAEWIRRKVKEEKGKNNEVIISRI